MIDLESLAQRLIQTGACMYVSGEARGQRRLRRHHRALGNDDGAGSSRAEGEPVPFRVQQLLLQFQRFGRHHIARARLPQSEHLVRNLHQDRVLVPLAADVALLQLQLLHSIIRL